MKKGPYSVCKRRNQKDAGFVKQNAQLRSHDLVKYTKINFCLHGALDNPNKNYVISKRKEEDALK
jgi:hypothetical protein